MTRGALLTMLSRVAFLLSGYAIHFSMAYLLAPAEYGSLGVIIGLITLWRVFLSAGLPQTTTQYVANDETQAREIWKKTLGLQLAASLVLWVLYLAATPLWVRLLSDASLAPHIITSSFMIPLMAWYQINLAHFIGRLQFTKQALSITLYSVARVVLSLAFVLIGMKIFGVVLGMTLALLVAALATHFAVPGQAPSERPLPGWRRLASFSLPLVLVSFGISALLNLDLLLLKRFFPHNDLIGFYNGAVNLGKSPYFLLSSFGVAMQPAVAKALAQEDRALARRLVERHTSYVLIISMPCAALVAGSAAKLLDFVYPANYAAAATALSLLIFSSAGVALISVLSSANVAAGRPMWSMFIFLGCVPLQCLLSLLLAPKFGMTGAASANLLTVAIGVAASTWLVRHQYGGVIEAPRVAKSALISAVLGGSFSLWHSYPLFALPALYVLGLAIYGALMYALGGINETELHALRKIMDRFRRASA